MTVHELSRTDARRIAVRAQLLDGAAEPRGVVPMVRHLTMVQADSTSAVAPSPDLVAWSRLGDEYRPGGLADAVDRQELIELSLRIRPPEDIALHRAEMDEWRAGDVEGWKRNNVAWVRANEACRSDILARLQSDGPLTSRDLPDTCARPWRSSGWNSNRNVLMMLEQLERCGEVAMAGREGGLRLWDLAERVYPDTPTIPADDALRTRNERRLTALGIARARTTATPGEPNDVSAVGEEAVVEGVRGSWRVDPEQLGRRFTGRLAILSPLDQLVFDRKRMVELFEFDYQLEMYKPAAKRRWGYWALPILSGDRLVGKVDAAAEHRAGVLRINAVHRDVDLSRAAAARLDAELRNLAAWLDLDLVQ